MPKKGVEPVRREQLIRATFQTIDEIGMADATVATIAKKAGLSSGIVAHYFGDKDGLLNAAMRQILRELKDAVARYRSEASDDPASSCVPSSMATSTTARSTVPQCASGSRSGPPACTSRNWPGCAPTTSACSPTCATSSTACCPTRRPAWPPVAGRDDRRPVAAWQPGRRQFNADKSRRIAYGYIDFQLQAAAL